MPAISGPARPTCILSRLLPALVLALAGLALLFAASLALGARPVPILDVLASFTRFDPGNPDHLVVRQMRLPRGLAGLVTGASLGTAGVVIQAVTRNPLADPGLLGISAGASLAVVLALWTGAAAMFWLPVVAVAGAGLAAVAVMLLGGIGSGGPAGIVRLTLAGAGLATLCLSLSSAIVLLDPEVRELFRFWTVGSLARAEAGRLAALWPLPLAGAALALAASRGLDALSLGEDVGRSLGESPGAVLPVALASVALLSGGAVAIAGPVGFAGLIVPHLVRAMTGPRMGPALILAVPVGGALVLACDIAGRLVVRPGELPLGIVLALVGGPIFLALLRRVAAR